MLNNDLHPWLEAMVAVTFHLINKHLDLGKYLANLPVI